jgi:hypothetical protein
VPANDLVERAVAAHGVEAFDAAREIVVDMSSGGLAFAVRFQRGTLSRFRARVSTGEPRAVFTPYPREGQRGVFERDAVRIESEEGEVVAERKRPREAFRGLRRNIWWDDLDLLHFAGYALWNYTTTPFLFRRPGIELEELEPWQEDGERWRRLRARFPPELPTHSREQDFYFDESGRLRRLDYTAEVIGSWAKAAHYCHEHRDFSGLVVPTRRRVTPRKRNNRARAHPVLVWIEISEVALE